MPGTAAAGLRLLVALGLVPLLPALLCAQADVTERSGHVEVSFRDSGAWRVISNVPYRLEAKDRIRTGLQSAATVTFPDGSRIKMGPNTSFVLSEADQRGGAVFLDLGVIHSWVRKALSAANKRFTVKTPAAVCSVRGTEFVVDINDKSEMNVEVMEGVVAVKTLLGEELEIGDGRAARSLRVLPDRPLEYSGARAAAPPAKKEPARMRAQEARPVAADLDNEDFKKDVRREVALGLAKEAVQSAAAVEARLAEYQEGKTMIDVGGQRVRLEQYIVRPAADQFKFVALNERESSFNYFYYQARFNQALPVELAPALRYLNGKTGAAPDYFITAFETGRSNTVDSIRENATGGHLVNTLLGEDRAIYDPDANSFRTVAAGTAFWSTLFDDYSYKINGTEKYGWQPAGAPNITAYDYVATGFQTRILGGGAACGAAGCAVGPVNCTAQACEDAARPSSITNPQGASRLHDRASITYSDGTWEKYDFYVVGDAGNIATSADFNGVTSGENYKKTLLKWNYEQVITASEFGGRTIDLVVSPAILVQSGVIP
ncbi:MAG: FecR domain-containing protein [Elusimicrobia bacterium]|nr:FecR domain-containing protein [Elusimicrobiota bacterium]